MGRGPVIGIGELIHVPRQDTRHPPLEFFWRGNRHQVRSWDSPGEAHGRRDNRRLYRIRTATGLRCMLSEDVGRGLWRLERILTT